MAIGCRGRVCVLWGCTACDGEESLSDGFGGCSGELGAVAADASCPAEQVVGCEAELHPDVVVHYAVEWEVREATGFGVTDNVLGSGALALFQSGDVAAFGVGNECGVSHPVDGVKQGELGSWVRPFTPHDEPGSVRPLVEVHEVGEFDDFGTWPHFGVCVDCWDPVMFLD